MTRTAQPFTLILAALVTLGVWSATLAVPTADAAPRSRTAHLV